MSNMSLPVVSLVSVLVMTILILLALLLSAWNGVNVIDGDQGETMVAVQSAAANNDDCVQHVDRHHDISFNINATPSSSPSSASPFSSRSSSSSPSFSSSAPCCPFLSSGVWSSSPSSSSSFLSEIWSSDACTNYEQYVSDIIVYLQQLKLEQQAYSDADYNTSSLSSPPTLPPSSSLPPPFPPSPPPPSPASISDLLSWLPALGSSIVLFGDSLDRYVVDHTCKILRDSVHELTDEAEETEEEEAGEGEEKRRRRRRNKRLVLQTEYVYPDMQLHGDKYSITSCYIVPLNLAVYSVFMFGGVPVSYIPWFNFRPRGIHHYLEYVEGQIERVREEEAEKGEEDAKKDAGEGRGRREKWKKRTKDSVNLVIMQAMLWDFDTTKDMSPQAWALNISDKFVTPIQEYFQTPILRHSCIDIPIASTAPSSLNIECINYMWLKQGCASMTTLLNLTNATDIIESWRSMQTIEEVNANMLLYKDVDSLCRKHEVRSPSARTPPIYAWRTAPLNTRHDQNVHRARNTAARTMTRKRGMYLLDYAKMLDGEENKYLTDGIHFQPFVSAAFFNMILNYLRIVTQEQEIAHHCKLSVY